jgi:hypothetical protein
MTSNFRWGTLVAATTRALRDSGECIVPFVECEVIPPFDGSPDGIFVWFICDSVTTRDGFRARALPYATGRLRTLVVEAGFPAAAAETLRTDVTSNEEIESGGGRVNFFR